MNGVETRRGFPELAFGVGEFCRTGFVFSKQLLEFFARDFVFGDVFDIFRVLLGHERHGLFHFRFQGGFRVDVFFPRELLFADNGAESLDELVGYDVGVGARQLRGALRLA